MNRARSFSCTALLILAANLPAAAAEQTSDSLETVKQNVDGDKAVLVDVRERSEWDEGHVEGAIFLPLSELKKGLSKEELAKRVQGDKVLYTYCRSGRRSVSAAEILEKVFTDVRALKPGYQDLIDAGFPKGEEEERR